MMTLMHELITFGSNSFFFIISGFNTWISASVFKKTSPNAWSFSVLPVIILLLYCFAMVGIYHIMQYCTLAPNKTCHPLCSVLHCSESLQGKRQPQSPQRGPAVEGNSNKMLFYMKTHHKVLCSGDICVWTGHHKSFYSKKRERR